MSAPIELKELGTLVVVVGKARNLPNKSRFGKQDPFCTVVIGEDKQKTKPIKRGGQHPEWDEELRFSITENVDDVLVRSESQPDSLSSSTNGAPPPLPKDTATGVITSAALANKSRKGPIGKKGVKSMKVACYADDAKEPELIGECAVDIEEVLKKGEVDEWYEFTYRDKYSGEVYLELTFFSNDAPPIKRNVPRPAVHNISGSAPLGGTPSSSLSSLASKTRLSGLNASASVSGMNLYIPPYMQPARAPSPVSQPPQVPPSNSFAELGLPPRHQSSQSLSLPGQPPYPPGHRSNTPMQDSQSALDSLTRPFSSMSIGSSYSSRPSLSTPAPSETSNLGHGYGAHRHSVGGPSEAPWGTLLPQSQPPPAPTPHPRPMSVNDAVPWNQIQRLEEERLRAGATPVPRPNSSQSYATPPPAQHYSAYPTPEHRIPSPIPESLRPAGPPQQAQLPRPHAHSFTQSSAATAPNQYPGLPPAPTPPIHPNSAPPISPSASSHYQIPTSSFSSLAQPSTEQYRAASPGPGQYPSQPQTAYPNGMGANPQYQQEHAGGYTRRDSYPLRPLAHDYQQAPPMHTYPPTNAISYQQAPQQAHQPPFPPQSSYPYAQQPLSPPRQPSPAPPQPMTHDDGYVPWYQQTQQTQQIPPQQHPSYNQQYDQRQQSYGSQPSASAPPPIPGYRPVPQPPPPPKPQQVGYYPSDELYAQQRQDTQTPQSSNGYHQPSRPSYEQQSSSNGSRQHDYQGYPQSTAAFSPPVQQSPSPYQPIPSPPQQQSWQGQAQNSMHTAPYGRSPSPQPPYNPTGYDNHLPPAQVEPQRAPSPQPPVPQNSYYRSPSPQPPAPNGYRSPSPQPPMQNSCHRAPSPQPQPQSYHSPHPSESWQSQQSQPLQAQAHIQQLVPPKRSHSPLPDLQRATSPAYHSQQTTSGQATKSDWRSYMQSLGTRSPSPQPPAKDHVYSQPSQPQQQQQQQWYTPPPSLPASIQPPEGWRSTLPAQKDGHQWRG